MKTVTNKTNAPIKIPLARNKQLRLGPNKSGNVSDTDAERPAVQKMIEAGQIELTEASAVRGGGGRGGAVGSAGRSRSGSGVGRRGGDR